MATPIAIPGTNPNFAPAPPNAEPLPANRQELPQDQWNADRLQAQDLLYELRRTVEAEATIASFKENGRFDHVGGDAIEADMRAKNIQQRQDILRSISDLAAGSNTNGIIDILTEHAGGQQNVRKGVDENVQSSRDAAHQADLHRNSRRADYHTLTRQQAANPPSDPKGAKKAEVLSVTRYSHANIAAQDAHAARIAHETAAKEYGNYQDLAADVANIITNEQHQRVTEANRVAGIAETSMNRWNIYGTEATPDQGAQVRENIRNLKDEIDRMGQHNPERDELVALHNRLRFRADQRQIYADSWTGAPRTVEFTDDKGIRSRRTNMITYEDGSSAREEGGEFVRRNPDGTEWQPLLESQRVPLDSVTAPTGKTYQEVFMDWEASRTPQRAAELYASIEDYLEPRQQFEQRHAQDLKDVQDQLSSTTDPVEIARLQSERNRITTELRAIRSEITPVMYWKGFLEVHGDLEPGAQPQPQARSRRLLGRLAGRATIQPTTTDRRPEITGNGIVLNINTRLHGRDSQWNILPNGMATRINRIDDTHSEIVTYAANGKVVNRAPV